MAPILKSISYLANTASAKFLSGSVSFFVQAELISYLVKALKCALFTIMNGFTYLTKSITSKAIASPSLSQSNHNIRTSAWAAYFWIFFTISYCLSTTYFSRGTLKSIFISVFFQSLHFFGNLYSFMWPQTEVTIMLAKYLSTNLHLNWKTGLYLLNESSFFGPSLNLHRWSDIDLATDGFSATLRITIGC